MSAFSGAQPAGGGPDLELVDRVERASLAGWPPTIVDERADGWILRATPGLERGRSCHALTPRVRALASGELPVAVERVRAWSARHGIRGGIQVSPLELHTQLVPALVAAGWSPTWQVSVMVAERERVLASPLAPLPGWACQRHASPGWLACWAACEPELDPLIIAAHARTVFAAIGARGIFGRLGEAAVGLAVEDPGGEWAGLFSLIVHQQLRGQGLGRRLVQSLVAAVSAPRIYLQVTVENAVARNLYTSLGFRPLYRYQHLLAPAGWADNR